MEDQLQERALQIVMPSLGFHAARPWISLRPGVDPVGISAFLQGTLLFGLPNAFLAVGSLTKGPRSHLADT